MLQVKPITWADDWPRIGDPLQGEGAFWTVHSLGVVYYSMLMEVSEVLKALADPNRLRILNLLHEKTLCVCDLEAILELNQSNLSRHLSRLRQAGIVSARKKALFTYYSRTPLPDPYGPIVDALCDAIHDDPAWESDRARLEKRLGANRNRC